jgi:DUF2914 family protein/tetratricopeptide repeat protein
MAEAAVELREILDAAEQAASVQDFALAESFLRQAASLQEAQLGSTHPDLANTLNNLGIVCERTGNASEAESCYRRAYAIARSTLPAEDPLVLTSGQNLREFCAATGRPFELVATQPETRPPATPAPVAAVPPAPMTPAPDAPSSAVPPAPVAPSATVPFPPRTTPASPASARINQDTLRIQTANVAAAAVPVEAKTSSRHGSAIWVVFGGAILLALIVLFAARMPRSSESALPAAAPEASLAETPAPAEQPSAPASSAAPEPTAVAPTPDRSAATEAAKPPSVPATRIAPDTGTTPTGSATVSLVESQLCRSLSNWRCSPATNPAEPGTFVFYTRVKSARDTTVQHRWYLNGDLRRSVDLRVGTNSSQGYRTFSRNTVGAERRGNWTIEVRDAGGALLHEERFRVE